MSDAIAKMTEGLSPPLKTAFQEIPNQKPPLCKGGKEPNQKAPLCKGGKELNQKAPLCKGGEELNQKAPQCKGGKEPNQKAPLCKGSCHLSDAIVKMTEGLFFISRSTIISMYLHTPSKFRCICLKPFACKI